MNFDFSNKLQEIQRYIMVKILSRRLPLYIVNEFPKSGGTWVGQLVAAALDLPFPRNSFRPLKSCVVHGHFFSPRGMNNVVVIWRDGRDVMVSWYHYCLFPNEYGTKPFVDRVQRLVPFSDYHNIKKNLPAFIKYAFTEQFYPRFSWVEFTKRWHSISNVVYVRYEDLHRNAVDELIRVVNQLTGKKISIKKATEVVNEFSFARQKKLIQDKNTAGGFLRKGIVGDWKNMFSPEAREIFNYYAGRELILLGYEQDDSWV